MLCNGCGKRIPFIGDVCPYCQRDKARAQVYHLAGYACATAMAMIGWMIWQEAGAFGGFVVGLIAVNILLGMRSSKPPAHKGS